MTYIASNDPKGAIPGMVKNTLASKQGAVAAKIGEIMKKEGFWLFICDRHTNSIIKITYVYRAHLIQGWV